MLTMCPRPQARLPSRARRVVHLLIAAAAWLALPSPARAQTDEIQVYDGSIAERGVFNLTLHNNFTPDGLTTPAFPGAVVSDKSWNGVPEWAYGIADWLEGGLYLPLYSVGRRDGRREAMINGAKLRVLFAVPHAADRRVFYAVNFEFSVNARHWDSSRVTSEVRPIVGFRAGRLDFIVNPILDTAYDGFGRLQFSPCARVAYNLSKATALAVEEYAGFGPLHRLYSAGLQSHQVFAVFDRSSKPLDVEVGIGFGLTGSSDRLVLKVMLSRDLK